MAYDLKTKIWQTGALDWWGMIGNDDVYLGSREFPLPPAEGDEWIVKKFCILAKRKSSASHGKFETPRS